VVGAPCRCSGGALRIMALPSPLTHAVKPRGLESIHCKISFSHQPNVFLPKRTRWGNCPCFSHRQRVPLDNPVSRRTSGSRRIRTADSMFSPMPLSSVPRCLRAFEAVLSSNTIISMVYVNPVMKKNIYAKMGEKPKFCRRDVPEWDNKGGKQEILPL